MGKRAGREFWTKLIDEFEETPGETHAEFATPVRCQRTPPGRPPPGRQQLVEMRVGRFDESGVALLGRKGKCLALGLDGLGQLAN